MTATALLHKLVASLSEEAEMQVDRVPNRNNRVIPFRSRRRSARLVACSVCLRVRDGRAWIEAGEVIHRLRTFEDEEVVRLGSALCDRCQIELRRQRPSGPNELAA